MAEPPEPPDPLAPAPAPRAPAQGPSWRACAGAAALAAGFVAFVATINAGFIIDDSFILYRYGVHIAEGVGPCFNPGEYVEGFTCFLWTYLLAGLAWLGCDLVVAAPVMGTGFALLGLFSTHRIARRLLARPWQAWGVTVLTAFSGPVAFWAAQGLETPLFAAAILGGIACDLSEWEDPARERPFPRSALCFGVAALTRPEGLFPFLLAFALRALQLRTRERSLADLVRYGLPFAALVVPLLLWRYGTFGELVPNTYYTKAHNSPFANLARGLKYTNEFVIYWGGSLVLPEWPARVLGSLLLFVVPAGVGLLRGGVWRRTALFLGLMAGAVCFEGGDWMPYSRFYVHILPLMLGLLLAAPQHPRVAPRVARALVPALALWLGLVWGHSTDHRRNGPTGTVREGRGIVESHEAIGRWLAAEARPGETVAVGDIGSIGYYSRLPLIDLLGLIDADLSRMPGTFPYKEIDPQLILAREPTFVVIVEYFSAQVALMETPRFQAEYRFLYRRNTRAYWEPPGTYWLQVWERRERTPPATPLESHPQTP